MRTYVIFIVFIATIVPTYPFTFVNNKAHNGPLTTSFMQEIATTFRPDVFFETGTFDGLNAKVASQYVKEVHTVELSSALYKQASNLLSREKNISVYFGSSPETITQVAPQLKGTIAFWLDAHYSGGNTALSNDNESDPEAVTAIRRELKAIKDCGIKDCIILIDDIRGFGSIINETEYLGCWAYPLLQEVCAMGKEINEHFAYALLGDILLMYDATRYQPQFSPVVQACTATRLYDGKNLTDAELLDHEMTIMNAQGDERAFIMDLYYRMTDYKDPMFYHDLWYALVSMGVENWQQALIGFEKVHHRSEYFNKRRERVNNSIPYTHWRIDSYIAECQKHVTGMRTFGKK